MLMLIVGLLTGVCFVLILQCVKLSKKIKLWENRYTELETNIEDRKEELQYLYDNKVKNFKSSFDASNTHFLSQALVGQSASIVAKNTQEIILRHYSRMSQEFLGVIGDEAEGLSRELHINLCENVWDSIQHFKEVNVESPYIIPDGCKIAYTKGNRTVLLIEQSPQVRTVSVKQSLVGERTAKSATSTFPKGYRFSLAFPYVYFLISFDKEQYQSCELYFRNSPLTSVREHIYLAPIPNVFRDKSRMEHETICMGGGFRDKVREETTLSRQAKAVISGFWLTPFNDDLGTGGFEKIIGSWRQWQEQTKENSLFILETNWKKGKTVKGAVDAMLNRREMQHENDSIDASLRKQLDDGVSKITSRLKRDIESSKKKHVLKKEDVEVAIKKDLENLVCDHTQRVFEHCTKKL